MGIRGDHASTSALLVLGGLKNDADLDKPSRLCGEHRVRRTSSTRSKYQAGS